VSWRKNHKHKDTFSLSTTTTAQRSRSNFYPTWRRVAGALTTSDDDADSNDSLGGCVCLCVNVCYAVVIW